VSRSSETASVALISASARVLGTLVLIAAGFRAVSDDDFARVVIAQRFAAAPHLDPTGTSWLPLPFWLVGSGMKVFGASLLVARVLAIVAAALAGAIVAGMAMAIGLSRRRAIAASLLAAWMPWAMQLGIATVPEVPAAACAAAGAMSLAASSPRLRVLGAVALLASCLSRYDAWPITLAFLIFTLIDAARARGTDRALLVVAGLVSIAGPLAWTAWQGAVYHDPFRYLGLVRSYRQALGTGPSLVRRVLGYPLGFLEDMREAAAAAVVGLVSLVVVRRRRRVAGEPPAPTLDVRWQRPLLLAALQLFVLILGDVRDGAPTHHPERALLGPATLVIFASCDAFGALLAGERSIAFRHRLAAAATVALALWIGVRVYRSLPWFQAAPRPREVAAGRALSGATGNGERVLVDTRDLPGGSPDYGYYALLAAFGRPLDADVDRDQDPRKPRVASSFAAPESLRARADATHARVLLAWGDDHRRAAESLGARLVVEESAVTDGATPRWFVLAMP
jgi:hypothetical protein